MYDSSEAWKHLTNRSEAKMRKLLLIAFLITFTGCAAVSKWTAAQADCASDPACLAAADRYAKAGQAVASPWGPVAGGAAASIIMFIALGALGLRKGNKK